MSHKKQYLSLFAVIFCLISFSVFASSVNENNAQDRLQKGEAVAEGGYLAKGVWGKLEGVVEAPPAIVWGLFQQSNQWKRYGLPQLIDSRAISLELAEQSKSLKKVEDVYRAIGSQTYNPLQNQKYHAVWDNYVFQYYNVPWPLSNRWMTLKNTFDETRADQDFYSARWERVSGNIATLIGRMTLEPFEGNNNRTLMKYYVETDPGASVPKFLLKWAVKNSLPGAIQAIRREAQRLVQKPAPLLKAN